jgi:hypothetical protein
MGVLEVSKAKATGAYSSLPSIKLGEFSVKVPKFSLAWPNSRDGRGLMRGVTWASRGAPHTAVAQISRTNSFIEIRSDGGGTQVPPIVLKISCRAKEKG